MAALRVTNRDSNRDEQSEHDEADEQEDDDDDVEHQTPLDRELLLNKFIRSYLHRARRVLLEARDTACIGRAMYEDESAPQQIDLVKARAYHVIADAMHASELRLQEALKSLTSTAAQEQARYSDAQYKVDSDSSSDGDDSDEEPPRK